MAPFIPQGLINPELNLFFALIIGFGFGYVLEQAGFSSSKKLAGVFYGYDFVVLRVFFTAGITAMTGLLFLSYLGWIDMSLVYINPTFLWSAILGGVIMGFGFILGGFCPGTSLVGAVIGKIDAMVFIVGMFIGIFIFGHYYSIFEPIYNGYYLGQPFIYETLGMSQKWFAFLLAFVALLAFIFTKILEDKINKVDIKQLNERPNYAMPSILLMLLMVIYLFLPAERASSIKERSPEAVIEMYNSGEYQADVVEVMFKIIREEADCIFIDVRDTLSVNRFMMPGAVHMPIEKLFDSQFRRLLNDKNQKKVFYSDGESKALSAWTLAARAGYENVYYLKGGLNEFFDAVFNNDEELSEEKNGNYMELYRHRFLSEAKIFFKEGKTIKALKPVKKPVKTIIEISVPAAAGGC
jgi:rhodanese-related sulfurtransferase/uncharacterized membrane protein YedE/YeeE